MFNKRTLCVEESMHVKFDESKMMSANKDYDEFEELIKSKQDDQRNKKMLNTLGDMVFQAHHMKLCLKTLKKIKVILMLIKKGDNQKFRMEASIFTSTGESYFSTWLKNSNYVQVKKTGYVFNVHIIYWTKEHQIRYEGYILGHVYERESSSVWEK